MRDGERGRIGEGGLIKNRKRRENTPRRGAGQAVDSRPERPKFERGDRPERPKFERGERPDRGTPNSATGPIASRRLPTSPEPKPAARGKKPEREQRPIEPPGQRKANVWMAPGARPIGTGRAAAEKAEVEARRRASQEASASRAAASRLRQAARRRTAAAATARVATAARDRAAAAAMRIVGGEFRGRPLATPRTNAIRPTTDRTREAVFNVLAHRFADKLAGARVLDLFAGTGALGLEALSRGASHCLFIEESAEGRGLIRTNVEAFGLNGRTKIFRRDATEARRGRHDAALRPGLRRSALWQGARRTALRSARGGRLAGARRAVRGRGSGAAAFRAGRRGLPSLDERGYGDTIIRFIEGGLNLGLAWIRPLLPAR